MALFEMPSLDSTPKNHEFFPTTAGSLLPDERKRVLLLATKAIVEKHVNLSLQLNDDQPRKSKSKKRRPTNKPDEVQQYASELLTLGLFLMEFIDAVREGDGDRICRCWSFLLLIFKATGRKNYAIEAFKLLAQLNYILSPRMATQLKWSRTINVHGRAGKNIAMDLHMEHLNRDLKGCISGQCSEKSIQRIGQTLGHLREIAQRYDDEHGVTVDSGSHPRKSDKADLEKIVHTLNNANVFQNKPGRKHRHFPKFTNIFKTLSRDKVVEWMTEQAHHLVHFN